MPTKPQEADVKVFGKLLRMGIADVQDLVRKGVVVVKSDGHIDTAQSLVAVAQHLVATRSTAEAKARAAEADAQLKERRLQAATKAAEPVKAQTRGGKYSAARGERICEAIANGASLRDAASVEEVSAAAVLKWVDRWPEFGKQYARARESQVNLFVDDILDAVARAYRAAENPEVGNQMISACKLEADIKRWMLTKLLPKKYGDRTQMVVEGANPADILPKHTAEEDAAFLRMLAEVQAKTPPPPPVSAHE